MSVHNEIRRFARRMYETTGVSGTFELGVPQPLFDRLVSDCDHERVKVWTGRLTRRAHRVEIMTEAGIVVVAPVRSTGEKDGRGT